MKIEIVKHSQGPIVSEVDIFETDETDGYNAVGKFIDKICDYVQFSGEMIISIGTKHIESDDYFITNEYYDGVNTWESDWWEGEPFIRIYGWCFIKDILFHPGTADYWFITNAGRNRIYDKL